MKTIILSDSKPQPFRSHAFLDQHSALSRQCGFDRIRVDVPADTHITHRGFLDYLGLAYRNHYSVVIKPDDIWFMVMAELALVITKNPENYASLFTTTPDKRQEIRVPTLDPTQINPALVIEHLKDCVPANVELFLPEFTTTTPASRLALHVAFCDMASPYYNYSTYLCGIPAIRVEGTEEDWARVADGFARLGQLIGGRLVDYFLLCSLCVSRLSKAASSDNARYFDKMVKIEPCGSGSQYEMSGWILDFVQSIKGKTQLQGLPPLIASMSYKNLDTNRTFKLSAGLTESVLEGDFLVPRYGHYVLETTNAPVLQPA